MTIIDKEEKLKDALSEFVQERQWERYHTPKNLAMALSVECSELLEIYQWMTPQESYLPEPDTMKHIEEEIGDIMIYLKMLAMKHDIDLFSAALAKLEKNKTKYPASLAHKKDTS